MEVAPGVPTPTKSPWCFCLALWASTDRLFLFQLWVTERLPMASSMEHGKDLPSVQLLMKKNQVRQRLKAKEKFPGASPDLDVCFFLRPGPPQC